MAELKPMNKNKQISVEFAKYLLIMLILVVSIGAIYFNFFDKEDATKGNKSVCEGCNFIKSYTYTVNIKEEVQAKIEEQTEIKRIERERLAKVEAERKRRLEEERLRRIEEKKKEEAKKHVVSRGSSYKGVNENLGTFNVSWYGTNCKGCHPEAVTASGVSVKNSIYYKGYGVAASDWSVIPPYSIIEVEGYGQYIVLDKGGAIKGRKLDLLTTSEAKSSEYGRQHLNVKVLRWGNKQ